MDSKTHSYYCMHISVCTVVCRPPLKRSKSAFTHIQRSVEHVGTPRLTVDSKTHSYYCMHISVCIVVCRPPLKRLKSPLSHIQRSVGHVGTPRLTVDSKTHSYYCMYISVCIDVGHQTYSIISLSSHPDLNLLYPN